ncbi:MAG: NUDIX domain-containing protein [Candidatus Methylomirabilales bacterium]
MAHRDAHPRPGLAVGCVVFGFDEGDLKVLLVRRAQPPSQGRWALPGGFVRMEESVDEAARRELREETGLGDVFLEQLYTFGEVDRHPGDRVVAVAYYGLVKRVSRPAAHARAASWFPASRVPPLAFDHARILQVGLERLRGKVRYVPIGFELLPPKFTLTELQHLYEAILGRSLDKRNFRKKVLAMDLLDDLEEVQRGVRHRAARLYSFNLKKYQRLAKQGVNFEL